LEADLIFVNGRVYTVDPARSWARAVAVSDERIVAVGADDDVLALRGSSTEIRDLAGRMLLPGFQDAHVHPVSGGVERLQCGLLELDSADAYLEAIAAYAAEHPEEPWILGGGWSMDAFPGGRPDAALLDRVVPDRPVYLHSRDGHTSWVNSEALRLAGITRDTPDPPDGRIERRDDGTPSGALQEGAAELVSRIVPEVDPDLVYRGLLEGQAYLHSLGITGWQDAIVDPQTQAAYERAAGRGTLTARVVGALWWDRHRGLEQIGELVERREASRVGRFAATSVKIMQDGVCENFTAAVLEPYLNGDGEPSGNVGISFVEPDLLARAVTELDRLGFQVHFHAIGERAVRESLDSIEAARAASGPSDGRHHIAHIQVIHPSDLPRFRALGAVANAQPLWAAHEAQMDELTIPFLGEPRWRWQYPFASLVRHGAVLAMGSDWSVSSPDPLQEIHVAVNRRMPPGYPYRVDDHRVFLPDERIDLATAIAGFTASAAFVNHRETQTGTIEVGKLADLTVIDRDLFTHPLDRVAEATVDETYVGGRRVFARES
jgi:predicted amidohydrolase YtcJ